jgi:hypothetical protein
MLTSIWVLTKKYFNDLYFDQQIGALCTLELVIVVYFNQQMGALCT